MMLSGYENKLFRLTPELVQSRYALLPYGNTIFVINFIKQLAHNIYYIRINSLDNKIELELAHISELQEVVG